MAPTRSVDSYLESYELIKRSQSSQSTFQIPRRPVSFKSHNEDDDDDYDSILKSTSKLPPKPLPGRPKYRPFITATLITISTIVPLAILMSCIKYMLPDMRWDGIKLHGTSCDLVNTKNSSRMQSAFQINLRGAAQLTFAEAKLVDLVFDLVVGQGGRLLLGAVSYIVFMDALLRSMEITPVSWKLYASLVFSSNSLIATWHSTKAVFSTKGWRAKTYMIWCALAMVYVLAFPTLIESATGYVSPSSAGFNTNNGTVVTADSDHLLSCFDVFGGELIGLTNHTQAKGPPAHVFDAMEYYSYGYGYHSGKDISPPGIDNTSLFYTLLNHVADPIYNATNSTRPPRYNHTSSSQYLSSPSYTSNITINGEMHFLHDMKPDELWKKAYCLDDTTLDASQLKESPFCFTKSYFVWGFSSIVLYIVLGLQILWTFGMYCVWLDANIFSELVRSGRTIRGPFRAAADLVEAMNETLGNEYCAYSEQEIEKALQRSGDTLKYDSLLREGSDVLHVGLSTDKDARVLMSRKRLYGRKGRKKRMEED
ncbi:MAG: hypothetical protein Q9222_007704 [Ikaeria aurantiellina]